MSDNTLLIDNLSRPVEIAFSETSNINKFNRMVREYIDTHNEALYANSPLYRLYFDTKKDRTPFYKILDIDEPVIKELTKKSTIIKNTWEIANNPFNIACVMSIRCATKLKNKELLNNLILYQTLSFYSSLHFKYFRFPPKEEIMNYTINNLSNKFLFKRYGVVIKALIHTSMSSHEKYESLLLSNNDYDLVRYLMFMNTRLNNLMKNFTSEYIKNAKDKKYLNKEKDDTSDENYNETDNISLRIARVTANATSKFVSSELNQKFLNVSAKFCDVSPITLKQALTNMKQTDPQEVENLVRKMLQIYLLDGNNSFDSISSKKFISYMSSIYSKNNTKDKNIIEMKKLLDYFLEKHSNKYSQTEREATRVSYRKALFFYFVFFVQSIQINQ